MFLKYNFSLHESLKNDGVSCNFVVSAINTIADLSSLFHFLAAFILFMWFEGAVCGH